MVNRRPESPNTATGGTLLGNDNTQLGVYVDRTSFDDDDDLKDIPQVIEEEPRSTSDSEGVTIKHGKVRRKLRWKPPNFRRKKTHNRVSSNSSVISALTTKSTSTSRSTSTTKSFLSHFSGRSRNSFHTFHSTETPVVTNKAGRPKAPHTVQRPNYPDTFENSNKPTTIDNDGSIYRNIHRTDTDQQVGANESAKPSVSNMPSRLDGLNITSGKRFDPYGSGSSLMSDPFDPLEEVEEPNRTKKNKKQKLPPLFKRKSRKGTDASGRKGQFIDSVILEEGSQSSSTNNSSVSPMAATHTAPTISNSESPLDSFVSMEREPSTLPVLEEEDFEQDRRVFIGTPPRRPGDLEDGASDANTAQTPASAANSNGQTSSPDRSFSALKTSPSNRSTPRKPYNRPIDRTSLGDVIAASSDCEIEAQQASDTDGSKRRQSVPVDLDDGAFLEAEHNLRAIHEMAAEHLAHDEYEEAIEVFEEILRAQKERFGEKHYRVGTALHNLGIVHMKRQDYDAAIKIFREAVDVRREALVPNHPDVAISLAQLGVANLEAGNYQMALLPFREALNIRRTFLGPGHPKCSKLLNNIGCALYSLDELDDARIVFQDALEIQRDTLRLMPGSEEAQESYAQSNNILLSMASTLCNLGSINLKKGQFEEASVALEEALLIQQSVLGDEHPVVGSTIDSIEFVENTRNSSTPSSLKPSWKANPEELEIEEDAMCRVGPGNVFSSLSPKVWFQKMESAFTETACGPLQSNDNDEPTEVESTTSGSDPVQPERESSSAGRYSV